MSNSKAPYPFDSKTEKILLPSAVDDELKLLLDAGKKLAAVNRVMELTGAGLRLAKDYVDALARSSARSVSILPAATYNEQVAQLLTRGETDWDDWDDYSSLGFTPKDVPELIRMGSDHYLLTSENVDDDAVWAPMHAWRALAQMNAVEAVAPLARVLAWGNESDSDLIFEGLQEVLERFGPPAVEPLVDFMLGEDCQGSALVGVGETLRTIAQNHPDQHERVVQAITTVLETRYKEIDDDVNGFLVAELLDLNAVASYPVIKQAYTDNKVDYHVCGDLEDIEIEFGLREKRSTPSPLKPSPFLQRYAPFPTLDAPAFELTSEEKKRQQSKDKKEKNKRKQAKKARKKGKKH